MSVPPGSIIVNADDFGQSSTVNRAIMACFDRGLISSATIMANMPGFDEACALAISSQLTGRIGVHLNLTDGWPLLPELRSNPALCDPSGKFRRFRSRLLSKSDRSMIAAEVGAQIQRCRAAGLPLTHADSHQHVHNEPMVFRAIQPVLKHLGIRHLRISRNMDSLRVVSPKYVAKFCFNRWVAFHGLQGTDYFGTVENFEHFRATDRLAGASIEILTHPSFNESGTLIDHLDNLPLEDRLAHAFCDLRLASYPDVEVRESGNLRAA
jgi:predicted glycoside hydrolase/deacetylase ChbG (UPF0249 family)